MTEFFIGLGEALGIHADWSDGWWIPIDLAMAKVNMCKELGSDTSGTRALFMHSMFELYIRENIADINSADDFDRYVKKFLDIVNAYIDRIVKAND